ncbi:MAG: GxxExxY protein [Desulfobacteraceae bacterium]|jgi:GxxExxY protein
MHTNKNSIVHRDLSYQIIGLAMEVHGKLGFGFLEKVYENAMMVLFRRENILAVQQAPIQVHFERQVIGSYIADILVDEKIILELKCVEMITNVHRTQALNYLKATQKRLAIILNFAKKRLEYERLVL